MKFILNALSLLLISTVAMAQTATIRGVVADNSSNVKLKNATISVLNSKDSTLYKFTRANTDGSFDFNNVKKGNFILLVTYPEYADFVNKFTLDSTQKSIDFKTIDMKTKAKLLNEVIIKGQAAAIKIKGDTTEFNASAYAIKPNDRVEDLLKQFPGIQVDAQGKITAQGKAVEKVLVDGEEFFGDDPTLVTKNLRADMVSKVQLFEKASDQAAFTGADDGNKKQTLNIILKEDKKQGYFGKIDAGYGTDDFYQGQAMINKFKNKEKMAAYLTLSNTARTGLGWEDANKYSSSNNMEMSDDGGMIFFGGGDDMDGGSYWGEGIPKAANGGLHYENKWNNDKQSINTNYKIAGLNVNKKKNIINQNNLPTGIINTNSDENSESDVFRQKIDATYNIKLDTTANLKVSIDGTLKNTESESMYSAIGQRGDNTLINTSTRLNTNDGKQQLFNLSAFYTKKLKKVGRNYSVALSQNYSKSNTDGLLQSNNNYYEEDGITLKRNELIDQLKDNDITSNKLAANITYNEPLSKFVKLVASYGLNFVANDAHKKTYDASSPNQYDILNSQYSNHFEADQLINQVGATFNYAKGKTVINLGGKTSFVNFDQVEKYTNQTFNRSFINWLPQAMYQYKFSAQKQLRLNYDGRTQQPSVSQLQPVRTNDDPFNIPEGNPLLKPSYSNNFGMYYNSYKVLSNQNFYVNASGSFTNNPIVSNNTTNSEGVTIYKSVNLDNQTPSSFYVYSGFSRKIKFLGDINAGLRMGVNASTNFNYVNSKLNKTTSQSYSPSINFNKYSDKGNQFYMSFGPRYNVQEASLQKNINNKGWGYSGYFDGQLKLPKKVTLSADLDYNYQPSSQSFSEDFEQLVFNAGLTKAFFKDEKIKLSLTARDILNQNKGFQRYASGNAITQTSYNNIGRYFMCSLIWDFNKMGGNTTKTN